MLGTEPDPVNSTTITMDSVSEEDISSNSVGSYHDRAAVILKDIIDSTWLWACDDVVNVPFASYVASCIFSAIDVLYLKNLGMVMNLALAFKSLMIAQR